MSGKIGQRKDCMIGLFVLRRDGQRQGVIEEYVINGFYLVRWNSWLTGDRMSMLATVSVDDLSENFDLYDDVDAWRDAGNRACERIRREQAKEQQG